MFDNLQNNLQRAFKTMTGQGKLTEANMAEGLQMIRDALLEADVNYEVVKDFIKRVRERAAGQKVLNSLKPKEQLMAIVHSELVNLMGPVDPDIHLRRDLTIIMMCGLQGSGKTTTCAKLARLIKHRHPEAKPMMVAADLQRPAAIEQLRILGEQIDVPVHLEMDNKDPVSVCQHALKKARETDASVLILDTAGRLHIDDELMGQLKSIDRKIGPHQVYMVVDGATGQDAVASAKAFNEALELDGVIMTKLDGDARGGATLSVKHVTGVPIKFIGTGEHLIDLSEFDAKRMTDRILGGGDLAGLIDRAQQLISAEEQKEMQEALAKGQFTLEDFRKQMKQISRLGSMGKLLEMIPGMGQMKEMMGDVDTDKQMKRLGGIIDSMTKEEKRNPKGCIDHSRRRRIAAGAGVEPNEVNDLVKQFEGMANVMKNMNNMSASERMREMQRIQGEMAGNPNANPFSKSKGSTGKRLSATEKKQQSKARAKDLRKIKRDARKKK